MTDLRNKTALITGSDRGIGRVITLRYAQLGARVVVDGSRSEDAALQTVEEIRTPGAEAVAVQGDVADLDAPENLFQQCIDTFGKPDIVVAHAGVEIVDQPISEVTTEQFDRLFARVLRRPARPPGQRPAPPHQRWRPGVTGGIPLRPTDSSGS
ncbi:SDR family NAD(P)-dependent oxidoreductase [Streptomyces anthocyanicus]|uniref:SDR family NAD(P)-dependent oxidoreductase n=1 Tax=Streptomyces anthocyanicus TaxID=68174 RepID=UPI00224301AF|nr:SDR family NAD(P)-dependent oxidoreductase [Streptomyces anthocyanicus]MCW8117812.1 SDR family NAD(P)-dependent oxidoreductase [Streptomyces anthocyanicus]